MKSCSWSTMAFGMPMMMWEKAMGSHRSSQAGISCHGVQKARSESCSSPASTTANRSHRATGGKNIVELASESGLFTRLVEALTAAGLGDTLKGAGPFTVFAPSDEAFSKLPQETLEAALKDTERLKSILTYHVVPGLYTSDMLAGIDSLKTVQGSPLKIDTSLGVKAGSAHVVKADVVVSNGVIHVIDSVLLPE